jgi:outer membrane murein-binding lipoprotein Lpp
MSPEIPSGSQFLATAIANLHMELAAAFDRLKAAEAENAELKAKLAEIKQPEGDGA